MDIDLELVSVQEREDGALLLHLQNGDGNHMDLLVTEPDRVAVLKALWSEYRAAVDDADARHVAWPTGKVYKVNINL